jgi:hypothetical protein
MQYFTADRVRETLNTKERDGQAKVTFRLGETDTAWNPASTKKFIHGPGAVTYTRHRDGGIDTEVR